MSDNVYDLCEYRSSGKVMTVTKSRRNKRIEQIDSIIKASNDVNTAIIGIIFSTELNSSDEDSPLRSYVDHLLESAGRLGRYLKARRVAIIEDEIAQSDELESSS